MKEDSIETFFDALITDKKERKLLELLSKEFDDEKILKTLLDKFVGES